MSASHLFEKKVLGNCTPINKYCAPGSGSSGQPTSSTKNQPTPNEYGTKTTSGKSTSSPNKDPGVSRQVENNLINLDLEEGLNKMVIRIRSATSGSGSSDMSRLVRTKEWFAFKSIQDLRRSFREKNGTTSSEDSIPEDVPGVEEDGPENVNSNSVFLTPPPLTPLVNHKHHHHLKFLAPTHSLPTESGGGSGSQEDEDNVFDMESAVKKTNSDGKLNENPAAAETKRYRFGFTSTTTTKSRFQQKAHHNMKQWNSPVCVSKTLSESVQELGRITKEVEVAEQELADVITLKRLTCDSKESLSSNDSAPPTATIGTGNGGNVNGSSGGSPPVWDSIWERQDSAYQAYLRANIARRQAATIIAKVETACEYQEKHLVNRAGQLSKRVNEEFPLVDPRVIQKLQSQNESAEESPTLDENNQQNPIIHAVIQ